jgi:hypothetical protein
MARFLRWASTWTSLKIINIIIGQPFLNSIDRYLTSTLKGVGFVKEDFVLKFGQKSSTYYQFAIYFFKQHFLWPKLPFHVANILFVVVFFAC